MMEWENLRLSNGKNVQSFTEEFRNKALKMNVSLDTSKTLMKHIVPLPNYIRHTLLLLNPSNMDEASVQETHIESKGKYVQDENPFKHGENHS